MVGRNRRLQANRGQEQEATGQQRLGTGGYRATEARNRRLQGNRGLEQGTIGQQRQERRIKGCGGQEQEATGQQRPGTGGYRATEARNRRLQGNRG